MSVDQSNLPKQATRFETRVAFVMLALITAFRLWYAATHGMANDETYYWQWSRHLSWGYYDQGPGIALCIRLGTLLFGDTSLGVRFIPIVLATITGWLVFQTAVRWLGGYTALWSVLLLSVAPLLSVGGILATYDNPQVFFWAAALYTLTLTIQNNQLLGWYVIGILVGLGALCKLTGWLFAPCVLVFLLLSPSHRRWLLTPHPYLGFALAILVYSPCLLWNMHHEWASFQHGAALGSRSRGAAPFRWFGEFLGSQAIVLGPLLFLAELQIMGQGIRHLRNKIEEDQCFLLSFTAPILLLCLVISLQSKMEANWPAPAHITGLMAVAVWFVSLWDKRKSMVRGTIAFSILFSLILVVVLLFPEVVPKLGITVSAELAQKATETYGWPELMGKIQSERKKLEEEGKPVFLAGINYRVPSLLAFYLPDRPETEELFFAARRDQYFFTANPKARISQNCLLCLDSDKEEAVELAKRYFDTVEALPPVEVYRTGFSGPVKHWQLYACRNFKGYNPDDHIQGW